MALIVHTISGKFDRPKLERLKEAYTVARKNGQDTFICDGQEYLVSYAHYLIEYLESQLPR